jgi:hypothetical protein
MLVFVGLALQHFADHLLAPFVTLGTVAGGSAIIGVLLGNAEALEAEMIPTEADAHIQSRYNDGLIIGGTVAFIPFVFLLFESVL